MHTQISGSNEKLNFSLEWFGKCPKDVKVLYIPTAGIEADGAREGIAICFHELFSMGIHYENILVYNLALIESSMMHLVMDLYMSESVQAVCMPQEI